jgi:hypothetical protein
MYIIYVPRLAEEHKFGYVPWLVEERKFIYVPRFWAEECKVRYVSRFWAEERKVRYVPWFRPRNVSSHMFLSFRPRNVSSDMFLGWPRNISSYVPRCHVAEEHKLCYSALMSVQSYIHQDIFLSYVSQPPTYVPQFLVEEHLSVSCSDVTRRGGVMTSAGEETTPGRGKEVDDVSWVDMNLIGLKNEEKKIHALDSADTNER